MPTPRRIAGVDQWPCRRANFITMTTAAASDDPISWIIVIIHERSRRYLVYVVLQWLSIAPVLPITRSARSLQPGTVIFGRQIISRLASVCRRNREVATRSIRAGVVIWGRPVRRLLRRGPSIPAPNGLSVSQRGSVDLLTGPATPQWRRSEEPDILAELWILIVDPTENMNYKAIRR